MMIAETERAIHDALCVVRNLVREKSVVCGGGAAEIAASIKINDAAKNCATQHQYGLRAFADALEEIPAALAHNSGLQAIEAVGVVKKRQMEEGNSKLGVDCVDAGTNDMFEQHVVDPVIGKM